MAVTYSNDLLHSIEEVQTLSSATTLTEGDSGKVLFLGLAGGFTVTLPSLKAGITFKFIVSVAPTTGNDYVITAPDATKIEGVAVVAGASVAGINETNVNFIGNAAKQGDVVQFHCDGTNWFVDGIGRGSGAITFTT